MQIEIISPAAKYERSTTSSNMNIAPYSTAVQSFPYHLAPSIMLPFFNITAPIMPMNISFTTKSITRYLIVG